MEIPRKNVVLGLETSYTMEHIKALLVVKYLNIKERTLILRIHRGDSFEGKI